jgi:ABC-type multidrug transport system fused ATPase/permease subunit
MSILQMTVQVWRHLGSRRHWQLVGLVLLMTMTAFAEILTIGSLVPFLAVLTVPESVAGNPLAALLMKILGLTNVKQLVLPLVVLFALAALLSGAARLLLLWVQTKLSHTIGADISTEIYKRTLYQPYAVHISRNSSEVIALVVHKANAVVGHTVIPCLTLISSAQILIGVLFTLIVIDPYIAVSSIIGFGGIYVIVIGLTRSGLKKHSEQVSREQTRVIKVLQEGLGSIRDVLIDGTQKCYLKSYKTADIRVREGLASIQFIGQSPRFGIEALGMILIASLVYYLSSRPGGINSALPTLGALTLGAQRLLPVLQQTYAAWTNMKAGEASLREALVLLGEPVLVQFETPPPKPLSFNQEIVIRDLSFRYAQDSHLVLQSINLIIPKGCRIGFIGTTGSGKSTLLDIIMGLLLPSSGSICIDGVSLTESNQRSWQAHIAHVPQAIFLADVSVAENIALGVPVEEIDMDRVRRAAEFSQISETIESWAEKYDALVGERGVRLSGGQRQRIGIARAFYKRASILVLDEATSALDERTEQSVMQALDRLAPDTTIFMVAHRLTTLRNCELIAEITEGRVSRIGTYADIIGFGAKPSQTAPRSLLGGGDGS